MNYKKIKIRKFKGETIDKIVGHLITKGTRDLDEIKQYISDTNEIKGAESIEDAANLVKVILATKKQGDKIILKDFSAEVKDGQKVAIVGPTGAGKTTLVKLLMRFYDLNSGEIYIDGVNVNEFDKKEVRNAFGMVLQDTWLFKGTIMENIR